MARAHNVYIVSLNSHVLRAFTVKHECASYLEENWPKCPTNLRVQRVRDGFLRPTETPEDITAKMYGMECASTAQEKDR